MEDNLNFSENGRQTQFQEMKDDLKFQEMEDDINFVENGRRHKLVRKWKKTSSFQKIENLSFQKIEDHLTSISAETQYL
jgi:hypothetical protein